MKMSTVTLEGLKDNIPLQLTGRYQQTKFPIQAFNDISQHLEKYADTRYMTAQLILPWQNGITDYLLDDRIRQVRGIYLLPNDLPLDANRRVVVSGVNQAGFPSVTPDKLNPIRFTELGNILRINHVPAADTPIHTDGRDILDSTGSTIQKLFDVDASGPLAVDENLRGKAIIITHASGAIDDLIIAASDNVENSLTVNGVMKEVPTDDTVYSIYNNYYIVEYAIYLPSRDVNTGVLTGVIGVPKDFESVYKWGMFWKYYAQEGENNTEIARYQKLFEEEAGRFASDQNRFRSDNFITYARPVPRMFPVSARR